MIANPWQIRVLVSLLLLSQLGGLNYLPGFSASVNSPNRVSINTQASTPTPPNRSFPIQAPWPASIKLHAGDDGSFYHDCPGPLKKHCKWDDFAIDFNGREKDSQGEITGETDDNGVLVLAVADGIVKEAKNRLDGYGWNVVLNHAYGFQSRYAHLKENQLLVKKGDWVALGTPLGYVSGSGGYGSHLHFSMYYCNPTKSDKECNQLKNLQAVQPEPLNGYTNISDGQQILSTNYSVAYEEIKGKGIKLPSNPQPHPQVLEKYKQYGGQYFGFGIASTPVNLSEKAGVYYQSFSPQQNQTFPWSGIPFSIVEVKDKAFLMPNTTWQEYDRTKGPHGRWGEPTGDAYEWQLHGSYGFRNDFSNGSIIFNENGTLDYLDEQSAAWTAEFFDNRSFTGTGVHRLDKNIDFQWPMGTSPGPVLGINEFSAIWRTTKPGIVQVSRLVINLQGHLEVWVNGKLKVKEDSPDKTQEFSKWSLGYGDQDVVVRFWQDNKWKDARLKLTVEGVSIVPPTFASEGEIISGSVQIPQIQYADFEPPPFPEEVIPPMPVTLLTSTILVFDSSGSMNEPDQSGSSKLQAAQAAGQSILEVIKAENLITETVDTEIGMVDFNFLAHVDAPLSTEISAVENALQNLRADGGTGMPDGLKSALDQFSQNAGDSEPILILLSDGVANIGHGNDQNIDPEEVKQQVLSQAERAKQMDVCIYTVGFGIPGGIGTVSGESSIDEELLKQIANTSGCGTYYNAQNAVQLANVYVELRHVSTGDILLKQEGQISQDQRVDIGNLQMPNNQSLLLYTLNWPGSRLDPILLDPLGKQIDENYPGASISMSSSITSVIVENPRSGQWQVAAYGVDVPEGITAYNAIVSGRVSAVTSAPLLGPGILLVLLALAGGGVAIYALVRKPKGKGAGSVSGAGAFLVGVSDGSTTNIPNLGILIGRGSDCNLRITDRAVSRHHARIRFAQGNWYLQDQGSSGGTYVNGSRVNATTLNEGDRIQIGQTEFIFRT